MSLFYIFIVLTLIFMLFIRINSNQQIQNNLHQTIYDKNSFTHYFHNKLYPHSIYDLYNLNEWLKKNIQAYNLQNVYLSKLYLFDIVNGPNNTTIIWLIKNKKDNTSNQSVIAYIIYWIELKNKYYIIDHMTPFKHSDLIQHPQNQNQFYANLFESRMNHYKLN